MNIVGISTVFQSSAVNLGDSAEVLIPHWLVNDRGIHDKARDRPDR